ncbi:LacI family DNA-binding transcriptional regulator [Paenibacillus guangzhouensis]|uniref:LacI family DNA-binding transcriptional regulator n=1 Tax=Paenibacillus guangzhouensis TaxID=1473112 RepID=UPI00187BC064|nr:LacI family DNA-binding transcriptional regulator [Paenibacillus guangzhouensis]
MVTRQDVADRAGVSAAVVSYVLNGRNNVREETKRRVLDAIRELGYRPNQTARSLKTKKTQQIAVLIHYIGNPFEAGLLLHIEATAKQHGYFVFVQTYDPNREEELRGLLMGRVDGVLLLGPCLSRETLAYFNSLEIPIVSVMQPSAWGEGNDIPYVDIAWLPVMRNLISHLRQRGHERIAFMSAAGPYLHYAVRYEAFCEGMRLEGLNTDAAASRYVDGSGRFEQAQLVLGRLLDGEEGALPDFTAIVCANDLMAAGCLAACHERGLRVPRDLAIAGSENILMSSQLSTPLTVIDYPRHLAGKAAMNMLFDRINGIITDPVLFSGNLIVRGST